MAKTKSSGHYKSAKTGRYISSKTGKAHPNTTYKESSKVKRPHASTRPPKSSKGN